MTQQPRTPTTENGRFLQAGLEALGFAEDDAAEQVAEVEAEARADLLAQIEKVVRKLAFVDAAADEYGGSHIDLDDLLSRLAAIRSAAPVEPTHRPVDQPIRSHYPHRPHEPICEECGHAWRAPCHDAPPVEPT